MIVHNVEQGTPEWHRLRMGIPTGSDFDQLITPKGKLAGDAARTFARKKLAEIYTNSPIYTPKTYWMERGSDLEQMAVDTYELMTDQETEKVGFITNDERTAGVSPDRLVKPNGLLEIKCPAADTHMEYMIENKVDIQYKPQLQSQMFITERDWVDWFSFHPLLEPVLIRVQRDEDYIQKIGKALRRFNDLKQIYVRKLQENNYHQPQF